MRARRLETTVPSEASRVRPVTERVVRACTGRGVGVGARPGGPAPSGPGRAFRLRAAVGEAVANAVRHGNRCDPARRVRVTAEVGPGGIRVSVQDEGEGFDPGAVPDPTGPAGRGRTDGRGLFLLRRLADEVRHEDGGRRVVLFLRA